MPSHLTDAEAAYYDNPPDSPWRARIPIHRDKNTYFPSRIVSIASLFLLALPLLLFIHHFHGGGSSAELAAPEELLAPQPVTVYQPPPELDQDLDSDPPSTPAVEVVDDDLESLDDAHPTVLPAAPAHPVTFALIMYSADSASEGALLLKSILMYSSAPVHIHIICDEPAEQYLRGRLALVTHPRHNVYVRFYPMTFDEMQARIHREGAITTDHSAGVPGLMKLFIHEILPDSVKRVIFLDTDALFISDPVLLWDQFDDFTPEAAISMPTHFEQSAPEWHNANRICSCVMLLDLEKLRKFRLMDSEAYRENQSSTPALSPPAFRAMFGSPGESGHYEGVKLGDQGYWWAIVSHRPELLQHLHFDYEVSSCLVGMYGTQLGDDDADESRARSTQRHVWDTPHQDDVILPKVLHFNCLDGTPRFFEWEGWSDPNNELTRNWGPAVFYHVGVKWLWLNQGRKDASNVIVETVRNVVFADELYRQEMAPYPQ